ncbi:helix-turn-helix domain-containing protein [Paeniglutamicibacter sp.]|uniref:helix-turn-helix domain-containing protein n=1 Tax=Paeniglutamicibacter sp. TaxID=1934391 RepID=UPI0039891977
MINISKHTFTPGQRIRVFPSGETGTISKPTPLFDELPARFVPIHLDSENNVRPCAADNLVTLEKVAVIEPCSPWEKLATPEHSETAEPMPDIEAITDVELIEELSRRRNDHEAVAMTAWLAKPIGHHASTCERTHRMICAMQIVRTRQSAYSVGLLADEIGTPRSTLRARLNGTGIITVTDICRISMAYGVPMPDLYALAEKGEIK